MLFREFANLNKSCILLSKDKVAGFFVFPERMIMNKARDGDFYKSVTVFGKTFDLYYGYYDEKERYAKFAEPVPIYPSFKDNPMYAEDGQPFVTEMQDVCDCFSKEYSDDACCADCAHFVRGEELIGLCGCRTRVKSI